MADQVFYSNGIKVLGPVRAVFPHLSAPDNRFGDPGDYKIGVDVTPEIEARFQAESAQVVSEAQAKNSVDDLPANTILKKGVNKRDEPFYRMEFKMSAERKSKGKVIKQRPQVVDANKNRVTEDVYGGSLVYIAYELQYSITGFGCNVTPKLKAVQVVELVGADGVSVDQVFEDYVNGFATEGGELPTPDPSTPNDEGTEPTAPAGGGVGAGSF
ncbi:MAG: hypothetical protein V3S01_06875 [Dehalococcoidia bacterium]